MVVIWGRAWLTGCIGAGFPVVVTDLEAPKAVRRTVALSTAVSDGEITIEGMTGRRLPIEDALSKVDGCVPVVVTETLPALGQSVVVDARLAKRNIDTAIDDASFVVALGPGFTAGVDCHAVVETMRGHDLGRVIWHSSAAPDTGTPGEVGGQGADRVLRAPAAGRARWQRSIGDSISKADVIGKVAGGELAAPFDGVIRGLIANGATVAAGQKVGDVDPRADRAACFTISDKSLAIGGGVLEAVLTWVGDSAD